MKLGFQIMLFGAWFLAYYLKTRCSASCSCALNNRLVILQDLANQKRNVIKDEKLVHYDDISYTACTACSPEYTFSQAYARWNKRPFFSEEGRVTPAQQLSGHSVPVRLILVDETQVLQHPHSFLSLSETKHYEVSSA